MFKLIREADPVTLKVGDDGYLSVVAMGTRGGAFDTGLAAIVTGVRTRLQLIAGEWFLNLDAGIPYFDRDGVDPAAVILGEAFDEPKIRAPFLTAILGTPGVISVSMLQIQFDSAERRVSITWRAICAFGETPEDTLVVGAQDA